MHAGVCGAGLPPPMSLSAPHADVTAGPSDVLGAAVTYTVYGPTRDIIFGCTGDTGVVNERYSKNSGAVTAFGNGTNLSMANGDTLAIGFAATSAAGVVTVTITDTLGSRLLDTLVLTVT
jgi:hypothetical protein